MSQSEKSMKFLARTPTRFSCLLSLFVVMIFAAAAQLRAEAKLDLGAEYRMRGVHYGNLTYASEPPAGSGLTTDADYYTQRARVYVKAKLDPGIEIGTVLQSIGVAGSTAPLL